MRRIVTSETREKLRRANKGQEPWNKGKCLSEEHKKKIGDANKISLLGNIPWHKGKKTGIVPWNKGRRSTDEEKQRISIKSKEMWVRIRSGELLMPKRCLSKESRESIRQKLTGRKLSRELRMKRSEMLKAANLKVHGGNIITPLYVSIRNSFEYKLWRSDVFERDKFTCQDCGESGCYLNADHIKPFAVIIFENNIKTMEQAKNCQQLWDLDNGKTLCVPCHRKTDTFARGTRKILTRIQNV